VDINQIKYFVTLSKTLNFSKAAALHGVTQPALTKAMQKLEENIGGTLIHRDGRDTRLTEFGKTALKTFEALLSEENKIRELADLASSGHNHKILFGVARTITPKNFNILFDGLVEKLPASRIVFNSVNDDNLAKQVLSGDLDCCFWSDFKEKNIKLESRKLYSERLLLACAPSHRFASMDVIPLKELQTVPMIDRINCEFRDIALNVIGDAGVKFNPAIQSTRDDWAQKIVAHGEAVCTLPEYSKVIPELVLKPIEGLTLVRNIHFVLVSGSSASEGAKKVSQIVRDLYA
jgi:LysR family hydrogen peroxide-inducible transcriptional activator